MDFIDYREFLKKTTSWFQLTRGNEIFSAAARLISDYQLANAGFFIYQKRLLNVPSPDPFTIYHPWGYFAGIPDLENLLSFHHLDELSPYTESWYELYEYPFFKHWRAENITYIGVWPITSSEQYIGAIILAKYRDHKPTFPLIEEERLLSICSYQISNAINSMLATRKIEVTNQALQERIQEQNRLEHHLRRSRDFHRLLSHVRDTLTQETEDTPLFQLICHYIAQYANCRTVWVMLPNDDGWFEILAGSGEMRYLEGIRISNRTDLPEGHGPGGRTWRTQQPVFNFPIDQELISAPWRTRIERYQLKKVTTLPIWRHGGIWAILAMVLSEETDFNDELQQLLVELTESMSSGLTRLDLSQKIQELFSINLTLTNGAASGISIVRYPERVIEEVNQRLIDMLGAKSSEELVNKKTRILCPDQNTYEKIAIFSNEVLLKGSGVLRDLPLQRMNRHVIWIDLYGNKIEASNDPRIVWTYVDVTERHHLEYAWRRSKEFQVLLSRANEAIAQSLEEASLLQQICELAIEYTHLGVVGIGRPNEEGWFHFSPIAGDIGYLEGIRISTHANLLEGNGPVGTSWRTQKPVFYNFIEHAPAMAPWQERIAKFGMKSGSALPIYRGVQVWGILIIYHIEENAFDGELQGILIDLARDIGFGLDRLDLARQERLASQFNDVLLNSLTAGVNVMRYPERVIEHINPRMLKIYGAISKEELEGHPGREFYPDETTFQHVGTFAKTVLHVGEGMMRDVPFLRKDGTVIYIDLSGQKFDRGDGINRIIWTHVEVTERHQNEQQIRELNHQKSLLLDNTIAGINLVRYPERVIAEANQQFAEMMGYDQLEEIIGLRAIDIYPNEHESQRMAELSLIIMSHGHGSLRDLKVRSRNGVEKYLDVSGVLLDVDTDHPSILWTNVDVTERHQLMEQLEQEALFDSLTGLPNRRYLESQLELALTDAERQKTNLAVVVIDLDGFKGINDTYGHDQGDFVLKISGERFQHSLRPNDFVARMGGDEFVLILSDIHYPDQVIEILKRIGESITAPIQLSENIIVKVGLSAGVCPYPFQEIRSSKTIFRMADQALYNSKAHKNNRENFWSLAD